eukprot:1731105-Amphidinium_carterae.1
MGLAAAVPRRRHCGDNGQQEIHKNDITTTCLVCASSVWSGKAVVHPQRYWLLFCSVATAHIDIPTRS